MATSAERKELERLIRRALVPYWAKQIPDDAAAFVYFVLLGSAMGNPVSTTGWCASEAPWQLVEQLACAHGEIEPEAARRGLQWLIRERMVIAPDGHGPGEPTFLIYDGESMPAALMQTMLRQMAERRQARQDAEKRAAVQP